MTKDEALQILDTIPTISEQVDALEMAIKALEQEPSDTVSRGAFEQVMWERDVAIKQLKELGYELGQKVEPCDAISRQAVDTLVDELARAISDERCCMSRGRNTATIMQDILDLPSATPKQKHGKWVLSGGYWRCSECKEKALLKLDKSKGGCREYEPVRSKHCPSCGAKMQESEG